MQPRLLSRYDVQALVDGELEGTEAEKVEKRIKKDDVLLEYYQQLNTQKELLRKWWANSKH